MSREVAREIVPGAWQDAAAGVNVWKRRTKDVTRQRKRRNVARSRSSSSVYIDLRLHSPDEQPFVWIRMRSDIQSHLRFRREAREREGVNHEEQRRRGRDQPQTEPAHHAPVTPLSGVEPEL